jgi:oxygen-dependent protoporphyrinogen oxidase
VVTGVKRWPEGQPQFTLGHFARIARLREACPPGMHLVGAAYDGVGVPDCIRGGQELAARLLPVAPAD